MLDRISSTLVPCYLANIKWELFHQYADEFMGVQVEQVQADLNTLLIKNTKFTLRAQHSSLRPEGLPWNIDMSLSFSRAPRPFDLWLGVQFAKDICLATGAQSFCNIPSEIALPDTSYFSQLSFYQTPNNELLSEIIQFKKMAEDHFVEISSNLVDLRNFELFQTVLPYR